MKTSIKKCDKGYRVFAVQGHQSFMIGYGMPAPLEDCRWMAKMFMYALREHDKAKAKKGKQ